MFHKLFCIFLFGCFLFKYAIADEFKILTVKFWETATLTEVKNAVDSGANIRNIVWNKKPILFIALEYNPNPEVIFFLIDQGLDAFTKDGDGYDGLYYLNKNSVLKKTNVQEVLLKRQKEDLFKSQILIFSVIFVLFILVCYFFYKRKIEHKK